jgi:hypothetical protein
MKVVLNRSKGGEHKVMQSKVIKKVYQKSDRWIWIRIRLSEVDRHYVANLSNAYIHDFNIFKENLKHFVKYVLA